MITQVSWDILINVKWSSYHCDYLIIYIYCWHCEWYVWLWHANKLQYTVSIFLRASYEKPNNHNHDLQYVFCSFQCFLLIFYCIVLYLIMTSDYDIPVSYSTLWAIFTSFLQKPKNHNHDLQYVFCSFQCFFMDFLLYCFISASGKLNLGLNLILAKLSNLLLQ